MSRPTIKQAMKKLYDIDMAKVNIPIRPNVEKTVNAHLSLDYGAPDVANKIWII
jgi:large subunit ribosomal protein L23Ae